MKATATYFESDNGNNDQSRRDWFRVQFEDGYTETFGLCTDGTMIDSDGMPCDDLSNGRNIAARSAIDAAPARVTYGRNVYDIAAIRNLMDDELCEQIHGTVETDQDFVDAYARAHAAKYGSAFVAN